MGFRVAIRAACFGFALSNQRFIIEQFSAHKIIVSIAYSGINSKQASIAIDLKPIGERATPSNSFTDLSCLAQDLRTLRSWGLSRSAITAAPVLD